MEYIVKIRKLVYNVAISVKGLYEGLMGRLLYYDDRELISLDDLTLEQMDTLKE